MRLGKAPPKRMLDPIERASRDEIAALQLKRLKATLKHAYDKVPAYRAKFDAAGVRPGDLRRLEHGARRSLTEAHAFLPVALWLHRIGFARNLWDHVRARLHHTPVSSTSVPLTVRESPRNSAITSPPSRVTVTS